MSFFSKIVRFLSRRLGRTRKPYRFIDHTADIAMEVSGRTLADLVRHAVWGLVEAMGGAGGVVAEKSVPVEIPYQNEEELIVKVLNEMLYQLSTQHFLTCDIRVRRIEGGTMSVALIGGVVTEKDERMLTEIKSATYHGLRVRHEEDGFLRATIVIDV